MKNFVTVIIVSLLLFSPSVEAQIIVAPLMYENVWVYGPDPGRVRVSITDTNTVIDSIIYFTIRTENGIPWKYMRLKENGYYAFRRDTTYQALNHEQLYYKKDAVIGDTWTIPDPYSPFNAVYTIEDTFVVTVFDEPTTVKFLTIDSGILLFEEYWTEKFGVLSRYQNAGGLWLQWSLVGCVIDGVVFGDTSLIPVSVEDEFDTPHDFILEQNYPNPFNPNTSIQYTIGNEQFVTIKVYDLVGREVEVLVNEEKPTGVYEILFDGSRLASGVYFYQLKAGSYIGIKKMIVTK